MDSGQESRNFPVCECEKVTEKGWTYRPGSGLVDWICPDCHGHVGVTPLDDLPTALRHRIFKTLGIDYD